MLLAGLLVLWQVLATIAGPHVLTTPLATVSKLFEIMAEPGFSRHASETGRAFITALVISLVGGLLLGVVLGAHRLSGEVAEPLLVGLYSIPKITLYPVVLLLFGLGMSAKIAFGAMHGIIPVILFTMNAVRSIPPVYIRAGRAMRLSPPQMFAHVLVPASLPEIVTGFRLGFALTLLGTLIGEMCLTARDRLHAYSCDGNQQYRCHRGAGLASGCAGHGGELVAARHRTSLTWAHTDVIHISSTARFSYD